MIMLCNLFLVTALVTTSTFVGAATATTTATDKDDSSSSLFVRQRTNNNKMTEERILSNEDEIPPVSQKLKKCGLFPTVSSLDLERYEGRWYLIYATDIPFINKRCNAANYVYNAPNPTTGTPPTIDIFNTAFCSFGEFCTPNEYVSTSGTLIPNPAFVNEPGKLLGRLEVDVAPFVTVPITFNYFVIDVVSDPNDESGPYKYAALIDPYYPGSGPQTYVISRTTTVDPNDEDIIEALLDKVGKAGIPLNNIISIEQEDVCQYDDF